MIPFDAEASRTAVTVGAQRIAAYADKHAIVIDPSQCEDLAELLFGDYRAFLAGLTHATGTRDAASASPAPRGIADDAQPAAHPITVRVGGRQPAGVHPPLVGP
ncbi:hypothetical protein ACFQ1L_40805 [Phytohabitans flavus]